MQIKYLGHSSFLLTSQSGVSVVCDPYDDSVGYDFPSVRADAVSVSHGHYDHDCVSAVGGSPLLLGSGGSVGDVSYTAVQTFHDECKGAKRGLNTVYKFFIDGVTVCHLGDLGEPPSEELIKKLKPADVLLIPVGGTYTIDAATAKIYVDKIRPRAVIPMHYRGAGCKINIAPPDGFLSLFEERNIVRTGCEITLTADGLNSGGITVIFMDRAVK